MAPLSYFTLQKLELLEVSILGIHQLAAGVPVTEPRDRDLVAKLLAAVPRRPGSRWETLLRSSHPEDRRRIAQLLDTALNLRRTA